jgi:hypothetical protein
VAGSAWQVFGYKLRVAHPSQPHLVVITYPDDTHRRAHFRIWGPKGGHAPLRSAINTVYSAYYRVNTRAWAKYWTPLFIPGGSGSEVTILFADSRNVRNLAPNHQGPAVLSPWAVGEVRLCEVTDPAKLLPPLAIAHPVKAEDQRYFGFTGLGYAESYLRDAANKDFLRQYLNHIGVNFLCFAGGQGGPAFGQPVFQNQLTMLDEIGVRTSFAFFKYFNAFLMDRIKTQTLPQSLIDTMPKRVKEAIDSLDGWRNPNNLYEGGSYQAKLMVMPLNWLDPEMGPWLADLVRYYLTPAAKHPCVAMVHFFGTARSERDANERSSLPKAVEAFTRAVQSVRKDLAVEVPSLYMNLRLRERSNLRVPYSFDYRQPFAIPGEGWADTTGLYDGWPEHMRGVVGGLGGSLWRGFHLPPPGLAILESKEARAAVQRFEDGWFAEFRVCEQNESESPKGIGWINDYYPWSGPAYRLNPLKMMAANPRYVVLNMGWEFSAGAETHLRTLAAAWRAFPWGVTEDLSAKLAPSGRRVTALKCQDRLLLLNQEPAKETVQLPPAAGGWWLDAVTSGESQGSAVTLEPFGARTLLLP